MLHNIPINRFPHSGYVEKYKFTPLVSPTPWCSLTQTTIYKFNFFSRNNDGNLEEDEFIKVGSADKILVCVHFSMGLLQKYLFLHRVAWQMRSSWIC